MRGPLLDLKQHENTSPAQDILHGKIVTRPHPHDMTSSGGQKRSARVQLDTEKLSKLSRFKDPSGSENSQATSKGAKGRRVISGCDNRDYAQELLSTTKEGDIEQMIFLVKQMKKDAKNVELQTKGLKTLVHLAKDYGDVREDALQVLKLTTSQDSGSKAISAGALDLCVTLIRQTTAREQVQLASLELLSIIASSSASGTSSVTTLGRAKVVHAGGVEVASMCLVHPLLQKEAVVAPSLQLLNILCQSSLGRAKALREATLFKCAACMNHHADSSAVQLAGLSILVSFISAGHEHRVSVVSVGPSELAASALRRHPHSANIVQVGLNVLSSLAKIGHEHLDKISDAGSIELAVGGMKRHAEVAAVQLAGIDLLVSLASSPDAHKSAIPSIIEQGGVEVCLASMRRVMDEELQNKAFKLMLLLSSTKEVSCDIPKQMIALGGVSSALHAIAFSSACMQVEAFNLLGHLLHREDAPERCGELLGSYLKQTEHEGRLNTLAIKSLDVMESQSSDAQIQITGLLLLSTVTDIETPRKSPDRSEQCWHARAICIAVKALDEHSRNDAVRTAAVKLLVRLCTAAGAEVVQSLPDVSSESAIHALVDAMGWVQSTARLDVQQQIDMQWACCVVLRSVICRANLQSLDGAGSMLTSAEGCRVIALCLEQHPKGWRLQEAGLRALTMLEARSCRHASQSSNTDSEAFRERLVDVSLQALNNASAECSSAGSVTSGERESILEAGIGLMLKVTNRKNGRRMLLAKGVAALAVTIAGDLQHTDGTRETALGLLINLSTGPEGRDAVCSAGAVKLGVRALECCRPRKLTPGSHADVGESMSYPVADGRQERIGALEEDCSSGSGHQDSIAITRTALRLLVNLVGVKEGRRALAQEADGQEVALVMGLLQDTEASAGVQEAGLRLLIHLEPRDKSSSSASAGESVALAIATLARHTVDAGVQVAGLWALEMLLRKSGDNCCRSDTMLQGLDSSMAALREHPTKVKVVEIALWLMGFLASVPHIASAPLVGGAARLAAAMLDAHPQQLPVQVAGLSALVNIVNHCETEGHPAEQVVDLLSVENVIGSLWAYPDSEGVQDAGLTLLAKKAFLGQWARAELVERGAVDVGVAGVKRHPTCAGVQEAGLSLLYLCTFGSIQTVLGVGGVELAVSAVKQHARSTRVLRMSMRLLGALMDHDIVVAVDLLYLGLADDLPAMLNEPATAAVAAHVKGRLQEACSNPLLLRSLLVPMNMHMLSQQAASTLAISLAHLLTGATLREVFACSQSPVLEALLFMLRGQSIDARRRAAHAISILLEAADRAPKQLAASQLGNCAMPCSEPTAPMCEEHALSNLEHFVASPSVEYDKQMDSVIDALRAAFYNWPNASAEI